MKFDLDYIEKLVTMVSDSELTELALEDGDRAILLKKEKEIVTAQTVAVAAPAAIQATPAPTAKTRKIPNREDKFSRLRSSKNRAQTVCFFCRWKRRASPFPCP